nr:hypothetical protein [Ornithinicoccus hortensis]
MSSQRSRELGATGIVRTDEQHFRHGLGDATLGLRGRGEPLAGQPGHQHGQKVRDRGDGCQLAVGGVDCLLDLLGGEHALERVGQVLHGRGQV